MAATAYYRTPAPLRALRRPPALRVGDRVAVVAPAGPVNPERLETGVRILRSWGLEVEVSPNCVGRHERFDYLAASDHLRAADLAAAWCDPSIAAVVCACGGYGAQRMVDLLDWDAMRQAAIKPLVGYSDITVLHEAFAQELGVSTIHGPMIAIRAFVEDPATQADLRAALFEPDARRIITSKAARTLVPGRARGITVGGCLSLLASSVGTANGRTAVSGAILLLEDIGEEPYRLDGYLTHLSRYGWLDGVAGIALGSWVECGELEDVRALVMDRLGGLGVPVVWELGFGHCVPQATVPLGVPAVLDADSAVLVVG